MEKYHPFDNLRFFDKIKMGRYFQKENYQLLKFCYVKYLLISRNSARRSLQMQTFISILLRLYYTHRKNMFTYHLFHETVSLKPNWSHFIYQGFLRTIFYRHRYSLFLKLFRTDSTTSLFIQNFWEIVWSNCKKMGYLR